MEMLRLEHVAEQVMKARSGTEQNGVLIVGKHVSSFAAEI